MIAITCGLVIYDEIKEVQRLIPQLEKELSGFQVEWIFVLNHEQPEIRLWIKKWLIENIKGELSCFENPLNNLGFARQILLTRAKNELIYLTDPDIELLPGSLVQLIEHSQAENQHPTSPKIAGYGGAVRNLSVHPFLNQTFHLVGEISKFFPFAFQTQNHSHPVLVDHLPACHLLLRKSAALAIGGFSHSQPRCGEDIDFTHRAFNLNYRFVFLPSAQVLHWQNMATWAWFSKIFVFGRAQIKVQKNNLKAGLRFYRLLPLIGLFLFLGFSYLSPLFFIFSASLLAATSFLRSSFFGFILILLSYSLGEMTELVWPSSELKNEVPLQELEANLTVQYFEARPNRLAEMEA